MRARSADVSVDSVSSSAIRARSADVSVDSAAAVSSSAMRLLNAFSTSERFAAACASSSAIFFCASLSLSWKSLSFSSNPFSGFAADTRAISARRALSVSLFAAMDDSARLSFATSSARSVSNLLACEMRASAAANFLPSTSAFAFSESICALIRRSSWWPPFALPETQPAASTRFCCCGCGRVATGCAFFCSVATRVILARAAAT